MPSPHMEQRVTHGDAFFFLGVTGTSKGPSAKSAMRAFISTAFMGYLAWGSPAFECTGPIERGAVNQIESRVGFLTVLEHRA